VAALARQRQRCALQPRRFIRVDGFL
jgi:hypothetical protein